MLNYLSSTPQLKSSLPGFRAEVSFLLFHGIFISYWLLDKYFSKIQYQWWNSYELSFRLLPTPSHGGAPMTLPLSRKKLARHVAHCFQGFPA
jgi:hypothetical protein